MLSPNNSNPHKRQRPIPISNPASLGPTSMFWFPTIEPSHRNQSYTNSSNPVISGRANNRILAGSAPERNFLVWLCQSILPIWDTKYRRFHDYSRPPKCSSPMKCPPIEWPSESNTHPFVALPVLSRQCNHLVW